MAFPWSYRSLCSVVSWPCHRRVAARTGVPCRSAFVRVAAPLCHVAGRCCAESQFVSLPLLRHKGRPQPRYNFCIVTPPLVMLRTLPQALTRRPAVSCAWMAVSWPCRAPDPPLPLACLGLFVCSACCVPARPAVCLLSLLCAYSACYVSAQPAVYHNTAEPAVCLLSLLCATIQLSVLCVCSACCVPLRPAMCHNTAEPAVCVLCAFSACCVPQYS